VIGSVRGWDNPENRNKKQTRGSTGKRSDTAKNSLSIKEGGDTTEEETNKKNGGSEESAERKEKRRREGGVTSCGGVQEDCRLASVDLDGKQRIDGGGGGGIRARWGVDQKEGREVGQWAEKGVRRSREKGMAANGTDLIGTRWNVGVGGSRWHQHERGREPSPMTESVDQPEN